jgi:hypothetical protein
MNAIGFDKQRTLAVAMLLKPLPQGIGYPDVKGSMVPARENVDVIHRRNTE